MAVSSRLTLASTTNGTTATFTRPAAVVDGDMLVVFGAVRSTTATTTAPTGWTKLALSTPSSTNTITLHAWWRTAPAGVTSYQFTSTSAVTGWEFLAYAGATTTVTTSAIGNGATAGAIAPSLTGIADGCLVNLWGFQGNVAVAANGYPAAPWASRGGLGFGSGQSTAAVQAGDQYIPSTAATGTRTITMASATAYASYSIRLDPSATGAPAAPSTVTATVQSTSSIQVAWSGGTSSNVTWTVEQSPTGAAGTWATEATGLTASPYTDTGLNPGTTYYYRVTAVSTGAAGSSPPSPTSSATTTAAAAETLVDDFASQDTTKWTGWATGQVEIISGQVQITSTTAYYTLNSAAAVNLTGSSVTVEVTQLASGVSGDTALYLDNSATTVPVTPRIDILVENGTLYNRYNVSANSDVTVAYNATSMRWWRISESGGTITWATSPDGTTWTTRRTATPGITVTRLWVHLSAGYWQTEAAPGSGRFDNFNNPPGTGPAYTGTAALAATGQLALDVAPDASGTPGMSATGALGVTGVPLAAGTGTVVLSGAGALTGAGVPAPSGAALLAGGGALTVVGAPALAGPGALSVSGSLTLSATPAVSGAPPLSATGTLTVAYAPIPTSGLAGWFDADAITGLADAAAVSAWTDLSGAGRTLTQATTAAQPTYRTGAAPSGRACVRFNGSSQFLANTAPFALSGGYTVFLAHKITAAVSGSYAFLNGNVNGIGFMVANTSVSRELILRNVADVIDGLYTVNTPEVWQADRGATGSNSFRVNNGTPTTSASAPAAPTTQMTVGVYETKTSGWYGGDMYELVIYTRQLTTAEIATVYNYLNDKWLTAPGVAYSGTVALAGTGALTPAGAGALNTAGAPAAAAGVPLVGAGVLNVVAAAVGARGAPNLAGTGSLTVLGGPALGGPVTLTGAGSLGAAVTPSPTGAPVLAAAGALSAGPALVQVGGAAGLSTTGSLAVPSRVPAVAGTVPLSGTGQLVTVGAPRPAAPVALSGTGTLVPAGAPSGIGAPLLAGTGSLVVTAAGGGAGVVTLNAAAALTLTALVAVSGAGGLAGQGTLTISPAGLTAAGVASLAGTGSLAVPARTPSVAVGLPLSVVGQLAFVAVPAVSGTAGMTGTGLLLVSASGGGAGVVALSAVGAFTAAALVAVSGTGGLAGQGVLTISAAGLTAAGVVVLSATGTLTVPARTPSFGVAVTLTTTGALTPTGVTAVGGVATLSSTGSLVVLGGGGAGPVPLSAAGSLVLGGAVVTVSAAAALTGVGALALGAIPAVGGSAALTGTGVLSPAGAPTPAGVVALTVTGQLIAAGAPRPVGVVILTATGTLIAGRIVPVGFTATGALTLGVVPSPAQLVTLSAAGVLVLSALRPVLLAGVALSTTGTLTPTGTRITVAGVAVALTALGALGLAAIPVIAGLGAFTGSGQLTFVGVAFGQVVHRPSMGRTARGAAGTTTRLGSGRTARGALGITPRPDTGRTNHT